MASWDEAELLLRTGARTPRVLLFDLDDDEHPEANVRTLARLVAPDRTLILASGTSPSFQELTALGFHHVLRRPFMIRDVASAVDQMLRLDAKPNSRAAR